MSTITKKQQKNIRTLVDKMVLVNDVGDEKNACSITAINLALSGMLTDDIPDCMSEVIGRWIIAAQDKMSSKMRNSPRWKAALPMAAGTGRKHEEERKKMLDDWFFSSVLPLLQPMADQCGLGPAWTRLHQERSDQARKDFRKKIDDVPRSNTEYYFINLTSGRLDHNCLNEVMEILTKDLVEDDTQLPPSEVPTDEVEEVERHYRHELMGLNRCREQNIANAIAMRDAWEKLDPAGVLERLIAVSE